MLRSRVRVRFAPSPTGHLHVGGARTAIFNWLFARHHGGDFVIRAEDTDQARSTRESEKMVLDDLRWLGLEWDEGPDVGGPHAPYRQSERIEIYRHASEQLLASEHVYRCFCSEELLQQKREAAERENRAPHYDLTCYGLTQQEIDAKLLSEIPHVIRFHVPRDNAHAFSGDVTIHDLIRGEVSWSAETLGDFIVLRSGGMPTYNFSVVVDDHEMGISHVIRAEEHLTNTHRQVLLYRALGWASPQFAHVSLILGEDRSKLSKRHGATSVSAYEQQGFLPQAMLNYLTLLGWLPADEREIFSAADATREFELADVNASPAVFDVRKFTWLNGQYLHSMEAEQIAPLLLPLLQKEGWIKERDSEVDGWIVAAADMAKKKVSVVTEMVEVLRFIFEFDALRVATAEENRDALLDEGAADLIRALRDDLKINGTPIDAESYSAMSERLKVATGRKGKQLFMPIRIAVTGTTHGPELHSAFALLQRASEISGIRPVTPPRERVDHILEAIGG